MIKAFNVLIFVNHGSPLLFFSLSFHFIFLYDHELPKKRRNDLNKSLIIAVLHCLSLCICCCFFLFFQANFIKCSIIVCNIKSLK